MSVDARSVDVQIQIHPSSAGPSRHPIACANEARRGRRKNWRLVLQARGPRTGLDWSRHALPCQYHDACTVYRLASSRGKKATAPPTAAATLLLHEALRSSATSGRGQSIISLLNAPLSPLAWRPLRLNEDPPLP